MKLEPRLLSFFLCAASLVAQGRVETFGCPGSYGQRIGAIERNSTLPHDDKITVQGGRTLFVRFLADTDRTVTGFDLDLGMPNGPRTVTAARLHAADANDRPAAELARGCLGIAQPSRWCRTSFEPYRILGGRLYFLAVDVVGALDVTCTAHSAGLDVAYFTKTTAGNLSEVRFAKILYRVNTDGTRPRIESVTPPTAHTLWVVRCKNAVPGRFTFLILGAGQQAVDLGPTYRGSFLWITPDFLPAWTGIANANGDAATAFPMPGPTFVFHAQWAVETPMGPDPLTLSDAQKLTIL